MTMRDMERAAYAALRPDAPATDEQIADAQAWARAAKERVLAARERWERSAGGACRQ